MNEMISWIFELMGRLLGMGWNCFTGLLGFAWKIFTALLDLGVRALSAVGRFLLGPLDRGIDFLWDGAWNFGSFFGAALAALLIACGLLALLAVGENLYRRYKNRG